MMLVTQEAKTFEVFGFFLVFFFFSLNAMKWQRGNKKNSAEACRGLFCFNTWHF